MEKEFRLNGKAYAMTQGESGKTYFNGIEQSDFFGSLSDEDKWTLDQAERRFRTAGNNKSRQQILDYLWRKKISGNNICDIDIRSVHRRLRVPAQN